VVKGWKSLQILDLAENDAERTNTLAYFWHDSFVRLTPDDEIRGPDYLWWVSIMGCWVQLAIDINKSVCSCQLGMIGAILVKGY
jgi:hypothetical protein